MDVNIKSLISRFEQLASNITWQNEKTVPTTPTAPKATRQLSRQIPNPALVILNDVQDQIEELHVQISQAQEINNENFIHILLTLVMLLLKLGETEAETSAIKQKKSMCLRQLQECNALLMKLRTDDYTVIETVVNKPIVTQKSVEVEVRKEVEVKCEVKHEAEIMKGRESFTLEPVVLRKKEEPQQQSSQIDNIRISRSSGNIYTKSDPDGDETDMMVTFKSVKMMKMKFEQPTNQRDITVENPRLNKLVKDLDGVEDPNKYERKHLAYFQETNANSTNEDVKIIEDEEVPQITTELASNEEVWSPEYSEEEAMGSVNVALLRTRWSTEEVKSPVHKEIKLVEDGYEDVKFRTQLSTETAQIKIEDDHSMKVTQLTSQWSQEEIKSPVRTALKIVIDANETELKSQSSVEAMKSEQTTSYFAKAELNNFHAEAEENIDTEFEKLFQREYSIESDHNSSNFLMTGISIEDYDSQLSPYSTSSTVIVGDAEHVMTSYSYSESFQETTKFSTTETHQVIKSESTIGGLSAAHLVMAATNSAPVVTEITEVRSHGPIITEHWHESFVTEERSNDHEITEEHHQTAAREDNHTDHSSDEDDEAELKKLLVEIAKYGKIIKETDSSEALANLEEDLCNLLIDLDAYDPGSDEELEERKLDGIRHLNFLMKDVVNRLGENANDN